MLKTGGNKGNGEDEFVGKDGRRKKIGEEDSSRYREVVNDNEGIDRAFFSTFELLVSFIKCSMA